MCLFICVTIKNTAFGLNQTFGLWLIWTHPLTHCCSFCLPSPSSISSFGFPPDAAAKMFSSVVTPHVTPTLRLPKNMKIAAAGLYSSWVHAYPDLMMKAQSCYWQTESHTVHCSGGEDLLVHWTGSPHGNSCNLETTRACWTSPIDTNACFGIVL